MPRRPRSRAPHRAILCRPRCAEPRAAACLALALALALARARPRPRRRPARRSPPGVAELLARVQDAAARSDPPAALAAVDGWTGPAHPHVDLARGHAYALADRLDPAITAYRAALAAEPTLRPAGLGLIAALARREHWPALTTELPRWHDPATADAPTLRLWLAAALGAEDAILAEEIARRALVRWPDEPRFRRGLAHALLVTERPAAAAAVIRRLIAAEPADPALWQQLAQAAPDAATRRAAPRSRRARRTHRPPAPRPPRRSAPRRRPRPAALAYARPLGATPLAIRAAVAADATEQAAAWLAAAIPAAADRDPRRLRRLAARVALARARPRHARAELAARSSPPTPPTSPCSCSSPPSNATPAPSTAPKPSSARAPPPPAPKPASPSPGSPTSSSAAVAAPKPPPSSAATSPPGPPTPPPARSSPSPRGEALVAAANRAPYSPP
ncbi:MAG: hypothetical protein H6703_02790 [Myxococcales bacterium]|nr:hypothetical protein [Myxococcales bacterium]